MGGVSDLVQLKNLRGHVMRNAKQEILEHVKGREVEFIKIAVSIGYEGKPLKIEGTLEEVLPRLDFEYDSGYGAQELFGFIWYADGTWSSRDEYDGAECWKHNICPDRNITVHV